MFCYGELTLRHKRTSADQLSARKQYITYDPAKCSKKRGSYVGILVLVALERRLEEDGSNDIHLLLNAGPYFSRR